MNFKGCEGVVVNQVMNDKYKLSVYWLAVGLCGLRGR